MLCDGSVARLAEFVSACRGDRHRGAKGRNDNGFHHNLFDVDVAASRVLLSNVKHCSGNASKKRRAMISPLLSGQTV